jgi:hypothetical protein
MSDSDNYANEKIDQLIEELRANTDAVLKMAQAMFILADRMIEPEDEHEPSEYLDGTPL